MARKSWIGALVKLNRDIETRGGTTFRAGCQMRVRDSDAGGLTLRTWVRGNWDGVSSVQKYDVTVVEWGVYYTPEEEVLRAEERAEALARAEREGTADVQKLEKNKWK